MGYARKILEDRRRVEEELETIRKQIDKIERIGAIGLRSSTPNVAKLPGKEEYIIQPRGTNNPGGAAAQHADGYEEALRRHAAKHRALMAEAERIIGMEEDTIDRDILRRYYCLAQDDVVIAREKVFSRSVITKRRNKTLDKLDGILNPEEHEITPQHT